MKRYTLILICFIISNITNAQDTIVQLDGTKILATILSIDDEYIAYKYPNDNSSNVYKMNREGVQRVDYTNGKTIVFETNVINNTPIYDMDKKGQMDARKYYKQKKHAPAGVFLTTVFATPVVGLVPAIITSSIPPNEDNLNYPSDSLMQNEVYNKAYKRTAKHKKQGRVWINYGVASIVNVTVAGIIVMGYAISQVQY